MFLKTPTVAMAAGALFWLSTAWAGEPIPGGAAVFLDELRPAEELPLEGASAQRPPAADDDLASQNITVEERRHFDRRLLQVGAALGTAVGTDAYFDLIGLYAEANVWDRLALGGGAGVSFSGPEASGYLRFRPIIWGGEGHHLLNAFTLRAEYTIMRQGAEPFSLCDENCAAQFVDRTAELGALSAGFEHQLWSGWTFRYDFGFAHVLSATAWKCERDRVPSRCDERPPSADMMVTSFGVSHEL